MRISRFNQVLLASYLLSVAFPYVFVLGMQNKLGEFFYVELFLHSIALITTPVAILVGFSCIVDFIHPFYFTLRKLKPKPVASSSVLKNYRKLCKSFELEKVPSLLVSDAAKSPFSLGIHKGKSLIILPRYVLDFEEEEKESIIAHELWHIKTDVEAAYFWLFEVVGSGVLLCFSGIAFFLIVVEHEFFGWWTKQVIIETSFYVITLDLYRENVIWILFIALTLPYCFSTLAKIFRVLSGYPAYLHYDDREYLADGCVSLITRKPKIMAKSLTDSARYLIFERVKEAFVQKIGFISPRSMQKARATKWSEIFSSKFTKNKHPPLKYRISLLHLLDKLSNSEVRFKWKNQPWKILTKLKINFLFFASPISHGKIFLTLSRYERWQIIDYMWKNRNKFNLEKCKKEMEIQDPREIFLVLYILLTNRIIDIIEPEYSEILATSG